MILFDERIKYDYTLERAFSQKGLVEIILWHSSSIVYKDNDCMRKYDNRYKYTHTTDNMGVKALLFFLPLRNKYLLTDKSQGCPWRQKSHLT